MFNAFAVQNPSMATKPRQPLTYKQLDVSKRLNAAWLKYKKQWRETHEYNMTHERAAAEITKAGHKELTGGAIGHWLNGREPIKPDRLVQFCELMSIDPLEIDPDLPIGHTVDEEESKFLYIVRNMAPDQRKAYMKIGEGLVEYKIKN